MIVVHHLEKSRSHRIIWLLEELELGYELQVHKRNKQTNLAPPELKKIHPLGKSPIVCINDLVLAESGAIMETLLDQFAGGHRLRPAAGSKEMVPYRYWMHAAEGSLMPLLLLKLIFSKILSDSPWFVKPITRVISTKINESYLDPGLSGLLDYMESTLGGGDWFAGSDFTAADIQMSYAVEALCSRQELVQAYPNLRKYFEKIKNRKAYQAAIKKGGPSLPL